MVREFILIAVLSASTAASAQQWASITNRTSYEVYFRVNCGEPFWSDVIALAPGQNYATSCDGQQPPNVTFVKSWLCGYEESAVNWAAGDLYFGETECGMNLFFENVYR